MAAPQHGMLIRGANGALYVIRFAQAERVPERRAEEINEKFPDIPPGHFVHEISEELANLLKAEGFCIGPLAAMCLDDPSFPP
jgi:hypothetical protein